MSAFSLIVQGMIGTGGVIGVSRWIARRVRMHGRVVINFGTPSDIGKPPQE